MKATVYIFKVALEGAPEIWRRIAVRSTQTLEHLHNAIFSAFDRYEEHLYSFYFPRPGYRGRNPIRNAEEFTSPYSIEEMENIFTGERPHNAAKTKLNSLPLKPKNTFYYLFDFGDSWMHMITVEAVEAPVEPGKYPRLMEKQGDSPPQYENDEEGEFWDDEDDDFDEEDEEDGDVDFDDGENEPEEEQEKEN